MEPTLTRRFGGLRLLASHGGILIYQHNSAEHFQTRPLEHLGELLLAEFVIGAPDLRTMTPCEINHLDKITFRVVGSLVTIVRSTQPPNDGLIAVLEATDHVFHFFRLFSSLSHARIVQRKKSPGHISPFVLNREILVIEIKLPGRCGSMELGWQKTSTG